MGGEHFSSATGKDLDKEKDAYVRFRWETKKGEKRPKQTILEREKIQENKDLSDWIEQNYLKHPERCVCCLKKEAFPLLRFEVYNWKRPKSEEGFFAHYECLQTAWSKLWATCEGLRLRNSVLLRRTGRRRNITQIIGDEV